MRDALDSILGCTGTTMLRSRLSGEFGRLLQLPGRLRGGLAAFLRSSGNAQLQSIWLSASGGLSRLEFGERSLSVGE